MSDHVLAMLCSMWVSPYFNQLLEVSFPTDYPVPLWPWSRSIECHAGLSQNVYSVNPTNTPHITELYINNLGIATEGHMEQLIGKYFVNCKLLCKQKVFVDYKAWGLPKLVTAKTPGHKQQIIPHGQDTTGTLLPAEQKLESIFKKSDLFLRFVHPQSTHVDTGWKDLKDVGSIY